MNYEIWHNASNGYYFLMNVSEGEENVFSSDDLEEVYARPELDGERPEPIEKS